MKKLFTALLLVSLNMTVAGTAHADLDKETVLSKRNVMLNVDVSTTKLKLSGAGYVTSVLKVLIPDLADVTVLDHRNEGESAPCMATYETLNPDDIIKGNPGIEKVKAQVTLSKLPMINTETNLCEITLHESISTKIRGFTFLHDRSKVIATRPVEDCR